MSSVRVPRAQAALSNAAAQLRDWAAIIARRLSAGHLRWSGALCAAFFMVQVTYIVRLPLVMDEFADAGHIYRLSQAVPYRDYSPYKTVLGYYLQLPALLAADDEWAAMLAVKLEIAGLTALVLWLVAARLRKHFGPLAVLGSLLLLCTQSTFLERASELRVDTLAALAGLLSLTALLDERYSLAATAAGCSALITQKGAYFIVALLGALALQALYCRSRRLAWEALRAALVIAIVLLAYFAFWCAIASPRLVWQSVFVEPGRIAFQHLYSSLSRYWVQTLSRNPVFYALGALSLWRLRPAWQVKQATPATRLWAYAVLLVGLCIWHKQPWPYFFVLLIPTVWVLSAGYLASVARTPLRHRAAHAILIGLGSSAALCRVPRVLERSAEAQRNVVAAANAFLRPGDTYLAGTEMLWRKTHVPELSWLDRPRLAALRQQSEAVEAELRRHPPRLLISNYRLHQLPENVRRLLSASYAPVGGNLQTYAPWVPAGTSTLDLAYGGEYLVRVAQGAELRVDAGTPVRDRERIIVSAGEHRIESTGPARLVSWSSASAFLDQTRRPSTNLFVNVYGY